MTQSNFDDLEDLFEAEDELIASTKPAKNAGELLPINLIKASIERSLIRSFTRASTFCLVIEAPSEDWVRPLMTATKAFGSWDLRHHKVTPDKARLAGLEDSSNDQVVVLLAKGCRIVGVSQDPRTLLPPAMITGADLLLKIGKPGNDVIAGVIKAVTGSMPKDLPDNVGARLNFDELAAAIRKGSTPQQCVDRLKRALSAKTSAADPLSDVPYIDDLHGYGDAQVWARNLVTDVEAWRRGEVTFRDIERQVVLYSEPGLGKSSLLKSLSKSTNLPLLSTSVAQWFANSTGYLDGVIKQINTLFDQARKMSPAIIFLDEIDAVPNRATMDRRGQDFWTPVVTHLLTTLDSTVSDANDKLVIVAATNHPERIDPALLRPGRLARLIKIERPDEAALRGILRQHLGDDLPGQDLSQAAQLGLGGTGADATGWVKSARRAARQQGRALSYDDLLSAIAPEDDRTEPLARQIAVHEAGHAVVGHVLQMGNIHRVTTIQKGAKGGATLLLPHDCVPDRAYIEKAVLYILGGRAAEEELLGIIASGAGGGAASDLALATTHVGSLYVNLGLGGSLVYRGSDEEIPRALNLDPSLRRQVDEDLNRLYEGALSIVRQNRGFVEAVAEELVERRNITGDRFLQIAESVGRQPAVKIEGAQ